MIKSRRSRGLLVHRRSVIRGHFPKLSVIIASVVTKEQYEDCEEEVNLSGSMQKGGPSVRVRNSQFKIGNVKGLVKKIANTVQRKFLLFTVKMF